MSDYWVSFAKNGKPDPKELPVWLLYTKENRNYIEFGDGVAPKKDLLPGVWEFYDKARRKGQRLR